VGFRQSPRLHFEGTGNKNIIVRIPFFRSPF
jgi:hypothetical protein